MNKGFSLIEIIIYIALLSLLLLGVFSSVLGWVYKSMEKPVFSDGDYQILIKNFHEK
ncbi:MAG TPA: prepilin-type N-terminal cleavage/methylation domain-containing protein [Candidatus Paceibacterota bacterium]